MFPGPAESILAVREEKFLCREPLWNASFSAWIFPRCRDVGRRLRSFHAYPRQVECRAKDLIGCSGTLPSIPHSTSIIDGRNSGRVKRSWYTGNRFARLF